VQQTNKAFHSMLEVRQQSGDFETWGVEKTIYSPETILLRWHRLGSSPAFNVEIADGPFPGGLVYAQFPGLLVQPAPAPGMVYHPVDLAPWLNQQPPQTPTSIYIRIVPSGGQPTSAVEITYMRDPSDTKFTSLGLDPNMLDPLRVFVDLDALHIETADEEDDEEPYLINLVLYLDGTTIDVMDLANSSIRLDASQGTHGNVPQYNGDLGSGDTAYLPESTGWFQTTLHPLNPELGDGLVDARELTQATTVIVASIAIEEDAVSTEAADALRSTLIVALEANLNEVLQSLTIADLLRLVQSGGDLNNLVPGENQALCDEFAELELGELDLEDLGLIIDCRPGLAQMVDEVVDLAIAMAIAEELDDVNLFENFAAGIDPDDFIGMGLATFSMEQLRTAPGPIDIDFFMERNNQSVNEPVPHFVRYHVLGSAGRCAETSESAPCTPYYAPVVWNEQLVFP
jgi:hypothetical protein